MKNYLINILIASILFVSCGNKSFAAGDYFEARKYLAEAIKLKPTDKNIIFKMSKVYAAQNMFDSAFASLSRADKLYPGDREINKLLHEMCVKTENWSAAIQTQLVLAQPGDSLEHYFKRIGEYALKDSSGHIAYYYYGQLVEFQPDSLSYYLNQAEGGLMSGEPQNSIDVLKAANKRFGDLPEILSDLGRLYSMMGNLSEAERTYRLLIKKDASAVNQLQLATVLAHQDKRPKKEEAYAMFKRLRLETANFSRVDSILRVLEAELSSR
jgi:tetratricopeptide (TPR) repeat protein